MTVKKTISFSETTLKTLESVVPKYKRSKFIDKAVIEALRQVAKEKAIDALVNIKKMDSGGKSVVETLRDIRKEESDRLINNQ